MSIQRVSGRQEVIAATIPFDYTTLEDGVAVDAIEVPNNAVLVGGMLVIDEAFDSGTSDAIDVGDSGDDDRYSSTPINAQVVGATALDLTGYRYAGVDNIALSWAADGTDATAGSGRLIVQYMVEGRSAFSQGEDDRASA